MTLSVASPADASLPATTHRLVFIDFARALAVVLMIIGHTTSALLAPQYNSGPGYELWQFQRGLTSSLFLLLSGLAFSVATSRHWASHTTLTPAVFRRVRRFLFFVLLGYTLHVPVLPLASLAGVSPAAWRTFLIVDVLQLIGTTFIAVQALVLLSRTRTVFTVTVLVLAALLVVLTPMVWAVDWTAVLPVGVAAYLSPATGSFFPFFPFAASVLLGAGIGQLYTRWGAAHLPTFANRVLLGGGALVAGGSLWLRLAGVRIYEVGPGASIPVEFALRTGVSLMILGAIAHASRPMTHLPRPLAAVAQESLIVYYVHLCVLYGSIWSPGLLQVIGASLRPLQTLPVAAALVVAMVLVAWQWHWCKHARPVAARWVRILIGLLVLYRIL